MTTYGVDGDSSGGYQNGGGGSNNKTVDTSNLPNQWGEVSGGGTGTSAPGAIDKPGEVTTKLQTIGVTSGVSRQVPPGSVESAKTSEAHFVETSKAIQSMLLNPDVVFAKGATQRGFEIASIAKSNFSPLSIKSREYIENPLPVLPNPLPTLYRSAKSAAIPTAPITPFSLIGATNPDSSILPVPLAVCSKDGRLRISSLGSSTPKRPRLTPISPICPNPMKFFSLSPTNCLYGL